MQLGFTALVATMVIANAASAAVVDQCTADMQASVNTLAAYKKCKTDSGFEFSKTAKADPAAFCASQKCLKLFKRLRKIDALSCTAYAGLDSLELWVKAKSKECFKNTVDPEPDVDADTDLTLETIAPVPPTIAPSPATTTLAPASTVATSTAPVPADSATVISECTTDMQASVNTLPAYKKCKTDSGFEFSTTAKADAVASCASQKCQNLFKKLRQLDALSCTAYAGLDYLELWVKGNPKTCFKNSDDSDTDSDDDVDLTTAPGTTTAPSTTTSPVPSTTTPAQSSTPAPASSGDVIDQCTADLQAEVSSLPAYKKCKADSGFEFSKTAKTDLVAFCASQKCLKLFKRLRKVDALSCTAYAGLDSLKLWEKGNPKECFKNADDSDSDSDEDPDLTSAPGTTTPAPTKTSPAPTTTTPTPTSSDDVIDQCTADMQAAMNALAAYKKCKADSGFELSKTAKTDTVAFCAS
ncbi:hypothetical protein Poli38472_012418 [Pythium oligandrum]|uniref:Elicitin n=1 Tax=Pythium oligandrum TaxID=41045 RepID=A0A8K1CRD4_PYTOL|nr:hypothetical protein Poli38472_012418 [Pythium oligandrum]|eukprot:TMW67302.1 hypothetical protein Poli38472_012418 [Pythium oligandrum]